MIIDEHFPNKNTIVENKTVRLELDKSQPWLPDPWNRSSLSWAPHPVQRIPKLEPVTGSRKGNKTEKNETDYDHFRDWVWLLGLGWNCQSLGRNRENDRKDWSS